MSHSHQVPRMFPPFRAIYFHVQLASYSWLCWWSGDCVVTFHRTHYFLSIPYLKFGFIRNQCQCLAATYVPNSTTWWWVSFRFLFCRQISEYSVINRCSLSVSEDHSKIRIVVFVESWCYLYISTTNQAHEYTLMLVASDFTIHLRIKSKSVYLANFVVWMNSCMKCKFLSIHCLIYCPISSPTVNNLREHLNIHAARFLFFSLPD